VHREVFIQKNHFFEGIRQATVKIGPYDTRFPIFYRDLTYLSIFLLAPLGKIRNLLPSKRMHPFRLTPWHSIFTITVSEYRDTDIGPYNQISIGIPIILDKMSPVLTGILRNPPEVPMIYTLSLPVTTEISRDIGLEMANYPEFLADIRFESGNQWINCQAEAEGKTLLQLSCRKIHLRPSPRERVYPMTLRQNCLLRSELAFCECETGRSKKQSDVRLEFGNHPIGLQLKELSLGRVLRYQYCPAGQAILSMVNESYTLEPH
jgi:hypothetical protein